MAYLKAKITDGSTNNNAFIIIVRAVRHMILEFNPINSEVIFNFLAQSMSAQSELDYICASRVRVIESRVVVNLVQIVILCT